MADLANPLPPERLPEINDTIDKLEKAQAAAKKAADAGIDVSAQMTQIDDQLGKLRKIKNVYFPGQ